MSDAWDDVMRKVEEDFERERLALKANKGPVTITGMRTSFPIQEVRRWPLDTVTLQMRAAKTRYRWVVSPWVDQGDPEAAVTLQVWRELEGLHRHVSTVGELHKMSLRWKGQLVEIPVISILGEDTERAKHPTVFQVGREDGHTGVTASECAVDTMRVLGNHPVEGISLQMRFLYYTLGAKSIIKDKSLEQFVENYSADEVLALYCAVSTGTTWTRPSIQEAGLHNFKLIPTTPVRNDTDERSEANDDEDYSDYSNDEDEDERGSSLDDDEEEEFDEENNEDEDDESPRPAKRRRLNRLDVNGDGKLCEKMKKRLQPLVNVRRLKMKFDDNDTDKGNAENSAGANEQSDTSEDAQGYTPPGKCQRLEDILVRTPQARRMAAAWDWSKVEPRFYKVAIPLAQKMGVKTLPTDSPMATASASNININANADQSTVTEDSMSSSSSQLSPRAELSGNQGTDTSSEDKPRRDEKRDTTIDLTGSSNDSLVFSPFLSKTGGKVVTVSTSSEEAGEPSKQKDDGGQDDSVVIEFDDHNATKREGDL